MVKEQEKLQKKHGVVTEGNDAEIVGKMYEEVMKRGRSCKKNKAAESEDPEASTKP